MGTRCAPAKLRPLSTEAQEMARQNIQTITRFLSQSKAMTVLTMKVFRPK